MKKAGVAGGISKGTSKDARLACRGEQFGPVIATEEQIEFPYVLASSSVNLLAGAISLGNPLPQSDLSKNHSPSPN